MDRLTTERRSWNMSRIHGANTVPERCVRSLLHRSGYRFSLHRKDLPGKPDIVLTKYKMVVFVHGCFWHGHECPRGRAPKSNADFWNAKIHRNKNRDNAAIAELKSLGWKVRIVWGCCIEADTAAILRLLRAATRSSPRKHT